VANHRGREDLFADTRMTFGEHIEELRWHLWRAILGFLIALVASFFISKPVLHYIIIKPVEDQLGKYYDKRLEGVMQEALEEARKNPEMAANRPVVVEQ